MNRQSKRLGGLEVYDQLYYLGLLHRQVGWLLAPENSANITSCNPMRIRNASAVGHEAAPIGPRVNAGDCWDRMTRRQGDHLVLLVEKE